MINIFTKQKQQLASDIDAWIVKYRTYKSGTSIEFPNVETCYQAFTDKEEAKEYIERLCDALKILGITSLPKPTMYLQDRNSL